MSDEEIEFLGATAAPRQRPQRPLTGIALNVEKSTNNEAYRLVFDRANGSVIQIGRRPGADSSRTQDIDPGNAMFRCAVVSRKHAKIAFSDSGSAYIIDLNSHHGTHVRKPGQLTSKMLVPELPIMLSDGDVLTFGKTVGRNEESVRPVVVRVELLRGPQPPFKPLFVPSPESDKSSSGRYGIYTSSGSSDDMVESEVEEIPFARPNANRENQGSLFASSASRMFDAVRSIFSDNRERDRENQPSSSNFPVSTDTLPPIIDPWSPITHLPSLNEAVGFNVSQPYNSTINNKSRSNSPMDLESPSSNAEVLDEPPVVGAWPGHGPPFTQASQDMAESPSVLDQGPPDLMVVGSPDSNSNKDELSEREESSPAADAEDQNRASPPMANHIASPEPSPEVEGAPSGTDLKDDIEKLQEDVRKLNNHRRKYRSRFNNNVHTISEKMAEYDARLKELTDQQIELSDRVESIDTSDISVQLNDISDRLGNLVDVEVPDLQAQVDSIDDEVSNLTRQYEDIGDVRDQANELVTEVRNEVTALQKLIEDMKQLRQKAREQMDTVLKDVEDETSKALSSQYQGPITKPLKRKREETDEGEVEESSVPASSSLTQTFADKTADGDANMLDITVEETLATQLPVGASSELLREVEALAPVSTPPPRKRMRKVASVVLHTATAVTFGAVATWSALAFT